jgi:predicted transcriptional regulator
LSAKRLSPELVDKIRRLKKDGLTNQAISEQLHISTSTVSRYTRQTEAEKKLGFAEEDLAGLPEDAKAEFAGLLKERAKLALEADIAELQARKEKAKSTANPEVMRALLGALTIITYRIAPSEEGMINEVTPLWRMLIWLAEKTDNPQLLQLIIHYLWNSLGYNDSKEFLDDFSANPKWMKAYGLTAELIKKNIEAEEA